MQLNFVNNAKRNIVFGVINKLVIIICPFIVRTVIQQTLGESYLGLSSLFSSILSVLSLTELGFGTAIVFNMYKPVAENDTEKVCALLNYYKKIYCRVGILILVIGVLLLPVLPYLVNGEISNDINLRGLYLIYLANAAISYFMYAYMSSLIVVYQREDINSKTNLVLTLFLSLGQIIILYTTKNYYLFTLLMPVFTVLNNLRIAFIVRRMFPQYQCRGDLDKDTIQDIRVRVSGAFVSRVCHISRNSFDSICTSIYLGLALTAMYNNYYHVMNAISSLMLIVSSSLRGGIGNHVVNKSIDENYNELRKLDFVYMWISGWCTVCLMCLFQPFMKLWMGEKLLLDSRCVILFCIYFYLLKTGDMRSLYSGANGLWWFHRFRSIAEALGNLFLNIVLGYFGGIYGIILATIITMVICNFLWASNITFRHYFGMDKYKEYLWYHLKYWGYTMGVMIITFGCCKIVDVKNSWVELVAKGIFCVVIPNVLYVIRYRNNGIYKEANKMICHLLKIR